MEVDTMAKYRKKGRKHGKAKPSLISMVPLVVVGYNAMEGWKSSGAQGAMYYAGSTLVPINFGTGQFDASRAAPFYISAVGAYAAKKIVAMTGVNRALKGLPFRL